MPNPDDPKGFPNPDDPRGTQLISPTFAVGAGLRSFVTQSPTGAWVCHGVPALAENGTWPSPVSWRPAQRSPTR
jgi:hypothetical protein